jgi:hypothetical protein
LRQLLIALWEEHWPGDDERLADFNIFFVHTPQSKN